MWTYTSLPNSSGFRDDFDTIFSDGYFDNVSDELSVGDGIYITSSEGSTFSVITSISPQVTTGFISTFGSNHFYATSLQVDLSSTSKIFIPAEPFFIESNNKATLVGIKIACPTVLTGNVDIDIKRNDSDLINTISLPNGFFVPPFSIYVETNVNKTDFGWQDFLSVEVTTPNPATAISHFTFGYLQNKDI